MKEKICIKCNKTYLPTSTRQKCCNQPIKLNCIICGKEFDGLCTLSFQKVTCSTECQQQYANQQKVKSAEVTSKICKWCGKPFVPKSARDTYCSEIHYQTCAVCGAQFEINVRKDQTTKTCSKKCRYALMNMHTDKQSAVATQRENLLKKYGVTNPAFVPGALEKSKKTSLDKYGAEYYSQTEMYKERVVQTDLKKYGVEHHLKAPSVILKRIQTSTERYGWPNMFPSQEGQAIAKQSMLDKYGATNQSFADSRI